MLKPRNYDGQDSLEVRNDMQSKQGNTIVLNKIYSAVRQSDSAMSVAMK